MKKIHLTDLRAVAHQRLPGYVAAVLAQGIVAGDVVTIPDSAFGLLRRKFALPVSKESERPPLQSPARFAACKACASAKDEGFSCIHHVGCCFGRWRSNPANHCPEGKW